MSDPYEEILSGEVWLRLPPARRHETICARLHALVAVSAAASPAFRLLPPRTLVQVRTGTMLRPDLALLNATTGRLWLAAEIVNAQDHRPDTVIKKTLYEEVGLPHLWMVDPRYDNVEIYASGAYGLTLKGILGNQDALTATDLPGFSVSMVGLFAAEP